MQPCWLWRWRKETTSSGMWVAWRRLPWILQKRTQAPQHHVVSSGRPIGRLEADISLLSCGNTGWDLCGFYATTFVVISHSSHKTIQCAFLLSIMKKTCLFSMSKGKTFCESKYLLLLNSWVWIWKSVAGRLRIKEQLRLQNTYDWGWTLHTLEPGSSPGHL